MEDFTDIYETMVRVSEKADMLCEAYEKQATDKVDLKRILQEEKEDKH